MGCSAHTGLHTHPYTFVLLTRSCHMNDTGRVQRVGTVRVVDSHLHCQPFVPSGYRPVLATGNQQAVSTCLKQLVASQDIYDLLAYPRYGHVENTGIIQDISNVL